MLNRNVPIVTFLQNRNIPVLINFTILHRNFPKTGYNFEFLGNRQRRIDTDLVQDNTENQILKELETISGVKATLTECLRNARDQLTASREAKHNLEMDWSDKVTSRNISNLFMFHISTFSIFKMRHSIQVRHF